MAPFDPGTWSIWVWLLHAWAAWYTWQFFVHFFRFRRLEAAVAAGEPGAMEAYNRGIRGFPANGYAKMLGKRALRR